MTSPANYMRVLGLSLLAGLGVWLVIEISHRATIPKNHASWWLEDRNGVFLGQIANGDRLGYWPLKTIPSRIEAATIALEDRDFRIHPGVDFSAIFRAVQQNITHRHRISGASTLAMQLVRLHHPARRTYANKAIESLAAIWMTARYGRDAILRNYLENVPYGNQTHGIRHAAQYYFNRDAESLSWAQIAFLAALPQAPSRMNPHRAAGMKAARQRAGRILEYLAQQQLFPASELVLAQAQLATLTVAPRPLRPSETLHVVLAMRDWLGQRRHPPGMVSLALDYPRQQQISGLLAEFLPDWRAAGAQQAAVIILDKKDRHVRVWIGSSDYDDPLYGAQNYGRSWRSPGSTLKPLIYALGFDRGVLSPDKPLPDLPDYAVGVENADNAYLGAILPRLALANSRNIPAALLAMRLGLEDTNRFLQRTGISDGRSESDRTGAGLAFGTLPTTLERLVTAYAMLSDAGRYQPLQFLDSPNPVPSRSMVTPQSATLVSNMLADAGARMPSFPRMGSVEYRHPVAVKTGTSQGYRDAWTLAFDSTMIVGVWTGRADAGPMRGLGGAAGPARLVQAIFAATDSADSRSGLQDNQPAAPQGSQPVSLCANGEVADAACPRILTEYLPATLGEDVVNPPKPILSYGQKSRLEIISPRNAITIWQNPEQPPEWQALRLMGETRPRGRKILWKIDGNRFAVSSDGDNIRWPLHPGIYRFSAEIAGQSDSRKTVTVTIK